MAKIEKMIGQQYWNWKVLEYSHFETKEYFCKKRNKIRTQKEHFLKVQCKCGVIKTVRPYPILNGKSKGCGCEGNHKNTQFKKTHGKTNTRLYRIYRSMKLRCYDDKDKDYPRYGKRGIKVCSEWLEDFENFYNWAMNNGYQKDLSIDRIDNDGNYSPNNCRWATNRTQSNNRRSNVFLTYKGETKTATEWARQLNVKADTLHNRKRLGWSDKDIILTPIGGKRCL